MNLEGKWSLTTPLMGLSHTCSYYEIFLQSVLDGEDGERIHFESLRKLCGCGCCVLDTNIKVPRGEFYLKDISNITVDVASSIL